MFAEILIRASALSITCKERVKKEIVQITLANNPGVIIVGFMNKLIPLTDSVFTAPSHVSARTSARVSQVAGANARMRAKETTPVFHGGRPGTGAFSKAKVAIPAGQVSRKVWQDPAGKSWASKAAYLAFKRGI